MKKLLEYIPLAILTTLAGLGLWLGSFIQDLATEREKDRQRMHTDPTTVIKTEEHIKQVEEDFKTRMEFQMHVDDITHELVQTAKELKNQRKQDSIIRMRDAITNYQTKQQVDTLIKFWREYNASVKTNNNSSTN